MVNCSKCCKKIGFFQSKYDYKDKDGNLLKYCFKCYENSQKEKGRIKKEKRKEEKEVKEKGDKFCFDSETRERFVYLIQKFRYGDKNLELPKDPEEYTGDNCWVCFNGAFRWYKGFRKICSDCVNILEGNSDLTKSVSNLNKITKERRDLLIKEEGRIKKEVKNREDRVQKEKIKEKKEIKEKQDDSGFDSDMKGRLEYFIRKFRFEERNLELPKDPRGYTGDNCWVCFDNGVRWYKGFRKICYDCVNVLESNDNLTKSVSNLNKIKKEKREFLIKEEGRIKKEVKEREDRVQKEEKYREKKLRKEIENAKKLKEKNTPLVSNYCRKYLQNKNFEFKGMILGINKSMLYLIEKEKLSGLEEYFSDLYGQSQGTPSSSHDYDENMELESSCNNGFQLIEDITKLRKLMNKKEILTDYIQIFEEMVKIVKQDLKKQIDQLTIPAHKKISKITTTDKKQIIKEFLKLGFGEPNLDVLSDLFNKFGLKCKEGEIKELLEECIEEQELDEFEKNLGMKKIRKIGDFNKLNGHQFEDYLKELFTLLDYKVVKTKGSGDQGADLIIKKNNEKTVVQAKKYSGSVTNKAIQEVVASKKHYKADKGMVVTTGKFTKSAMELAKSNKVELWDKDKLNEIISKINKK